MTTEQFERMKALILKRFRLGLPMPDCLNCGGKCHGKPWGCYQFLKTAPNSARDKLTVVIQPSDAFETKNNPRKITHILKDIDEVLTFDYLKSRGLLKDKGCEITECCELWKEKNDL